MKQSIFKNTRGISHILVPLAIVIAVGLIGTEVYVVSRAATPTKSETVAAPAATTSSKKNCSLSAKLVPSCGVLWGAFVPNYNLTTLEQQVGRKFNIFQEYNDFSSGDRIPNANELKLMQGGRTLLASWENILFSNTNTVYSYGSIASGALDKSIIIPQAKQIKALGSTKIFLSFDPEMNDTSRRPVSTYGTATQFIAAYRHIYNVFKAQGVSNVVWVWTTTGGIYSSTQPKDAVYYYPGDAYVDWIGYDPYNFNQCSGSPWKSTYATLSAYYNWVQAGSLGKGAESKPMIVDEYGSYGDAHDPIKNDTNWYAQIPSALTKLPKLKGLSEFDNTDYCIVPLTSYAPDLAGFKQAGLSKTVEGN